MPSAASPQASNAVQTAAEVRRRTERLSRLLDAAVRIPGTRISFGLDALIGMVPVAGDVVGFAVGGWFLLEGARVGAPAPLLARMAGNIVLDALIGFVPLVGDLADVAFKANVRNARLLGAYLDQLSPPPAGLPLPPQRRSYGTAALLLGILGAALYGVWTLATQLLS
jgi:hypothetical protein